MLRLAYLALLVAVALLSFSVVPAVWPEFQAGSPTLAAVPAWAVTATLVVLAIGGCYAVTRFDLR